MGRQTRDRSVACFTALKLLVEMTVVAVMRGTVEDRGLQLIAPISRAVRTHEVHELMLTDQQPADRSAPVHRIAYLAFVEVVQGGVVIVDDEVRLGTMRIGTILGFDDGHMPNHQNILIRADKRVDGLELGLSPGAAVSIVAPS